MDKILLTTCFCQATKTTPTIWTQTVCRKLCLFILFSSLHWFWSECELFKYSKEVKGSVCVCLFIFLGEGRAIIFTKKYNNNITMVIQSGWRMREQDHYFFHLALLFIELMKNLKKEIEFLIWDKLLFLTMFARS